MKIHIGTPPNWQPGQPLHGVEIGQGLNTKIAFGTHLIGETRRGERKRKPAPEPPRVYASHWQVIRQLVCICGPNTKWLLWVAEKGILVYCRQGSNLEYKELPWLK